MILDIILACEFCYIRPNLKMFSPVLMYTLLVLNVGETKITTEIKRWDCEKNGWGKISDQIGLLFTNTLGYQELKAKSHHLLRNSLFTECFDLSGTNFCVALWQMWAINQKAQKLQDVFFLFFFHTLALQPFLPGLINSSDTFSNLPPPLLHYWFTKRLFGQGDRRQ